MLNFYKYNLDKNYTKLDVLRYNSLRRIMSNIVEHSSLYVPSINSQSEMDWDVFSIYTIGHYLWRFDNLKILERFRSLHWLEYNKNVIFLAIQELNPIQNSKLYVFQENVPRQLFSFKKHKIVC